MTPRERAKMLLQISSVQEMWPEHRQRFVDQIEAAIAAAEAAARADERAKTIEESARFVEGGRFLHDDAPPARFARECAREMRRALAQPQPSGEGE